MTNCKKPFKDKRFYLDLRYYRYQDELIKNLRKLGGKVESFFSREVSHVITDKPNVNQKQDQWLPNTPKSMISSPRNVNSHDSILGSLEVTSVTNSVTDVVNNSAMSRGLALVQKAKQKHQGTTDLYEVCNQWNIKVVQLKKVVSFINKNCISVKNVENNQPRNRMKDLVKCVPEKLSPPFIKIEDRKRYYKPNYKVFKTWKDICDPDIWRIASQLKLQLQENREALKPSQVQNIANQQISSTQLKDSSVSLLASPGPSQVFSFGNSSKTTTIPVNYSTDKIGRNQNSTKNKSKPHPEKKAIPKKRYCEICSCTYIKLEEHIISKKHREYVIDSSNFLVLKKLIATLPTVEAFLKKHGASSEECVLSGQLPHPKLRNKKNVSRIENQKKEKQTQNDLNQNDTMILEDVVPVTAPLTDSDIISPSCSTVKSSFFSSPIIGLQCQLPNLQDANIISRSDCDDIAPFNGDCIMTGIHNEPSNIECSQKADMDEFVHNNSSGPCNMTKEVLDSLCCNVTCENDPHGLGNVSVMGEKVLGEAIITADDYLNGFLLYNTGLENCCELGCAECSVCVDNKPVAVDNCSIGNSNSISALPFKNLGHDSVPGNELCRTPLGNNVMFGGSSFWNKGLNDLIEKNNDGDYGFDSSDDAKVHWKDLKSEIDNVCKSLEADKEEATPAIDLSIPKQSENNSVCPETVINNEPKGIELDVDVSKKDELES